ncbi:hypothetical protein ACOWPH_25490 [Anabaena sp. PCC 7938]|nr:hypothetical protein [Anabaena sp. CCAP 1446/1C]MBY5285081.1 type II toxin-antitoxin system RelE/ParE family toxin [Anabaena sp. CCAP 1446/1C]
MVTVQLANTFDTCIFYLQRDESIEIVRLIHSAQDISQILAEEE